MLLKPATSRDIWTSAAHTWAKVSKGISAGRICHAGDRGERAQVLEAEDPGDLNSEMKTPASPSKACGPGSTGHGSWDMAPFPSHCAFTSGLSPLRHIPSLVLSLPMSMGSSSDINRARKQSVGAWHAQHHPPLEGRPAKYQLPEELWGQPLRWGRDPKGRSQSL